MYVNIYIYNSPMYVFVYVYTYIYIYIYISVDGPAPGPDPKPAGTNAQDSWHLFPWAFLGVHYILVLSKSIISPSLLSFLELNSYWPRHRLGPGPDPKPTGTKHRTHDICPHELFCRVHYILVLNKWIILRLYCSRYCPFLGWRAIDPFMGRARARAPSPWEQTHRTHEICPHGPSGGYAMYWH